MTSVKTLTMEAYESINAPESAQAWIWLLTISHPNITPTLRFARNWRAVPSRGDVYDTLGFVPSIAQEEPDRPPRLMLTVQNVSRVVTAKLEQAAGTDDVPKVTLEVVLASDPNTVEYVLDDFEIQNARYDQAVLTTDLKVEDYLSEPFGDLKFTPEIAPGVHRR